jgi:Zn-dependent protease
LLFAVFTLALTPGDDFWHGLIMIGVLLGSLMLHEAAHTLAAIRLGGKVDQVVISPVGGLSSPRVPDEPEIQVFVALAGPIVNLSLVVVATAWLALNGYKEIRELFNPMVTAQLVEGSYAVVSVKLLLWLNWILTLVNMIPAYPFDGAPIVRAMLWPVVGRRTACVATSRLAMGVSVAMVVLGFLWLPGENQPPSIVPLWLPTLTLATFVFFSARQDLAAAQRLDLSDDMAGYNVRGDGLDLLDELWSQDDDDDAVLVHERNNRRQERQEEAIRAQEEYEDARVDDILARLHGSSLNDLSREEIELLKRASKRYRERRKMKDASAKR